MRAEENVATRAHRCVVVIIPVLNEEEALPQVLRQIPKDLVSRVVVVDNGSTDASARLALEQGACVLAEPRRGYGAACWAGIRAADDADILVFLDGDNSDFPEDMRELLAPVVKGEADLVIGTRMANRASRMALPPHSRFGNFIASRLLRLVYGVRCTDLGPFRVINRETLRALDMQDRGYGWTVEMQVKAHLIHARTIELPVRYRPRIGKSKITGTLRGSLGATAKIVATILRLRLRGRGDRANGAAITPPGTLKSAAGIEG